MKLKQIEDQIQVTKDAIASLTAELANTEQAIASNEARIEACMDETIIDDLIDEVSDENANLKKQQVKTRLKLRNLEAKLESLETESLAKAKADNEVKARTYCNKIEGLIAEYKVSAQSVVDINAKIKAILQEARLDTGLGFSPDTLNNPKLYTIEGTLRNELVGMTTGAEISAGIKPVTEERWIFSFINGSLIEAKVQ